LWWDGLPYDYRTRRGAIDCLRFDSHLALVDRTTVLREPWRLSHLSLFEAKRETWMASQANRSGFTLDPASRFPDVWQAAGRFELNTTAIDSAVFRHQELWWLAEAPVARFAEKQDRLVHPSSLQGRDNHEAMRDLVNLAAIEAESELHDVATTPVARRLNASEPKRRLTSGLPLQSQRSRAPRPLRRKAPEKLVSSKKHLEVITPRSCWASWRRSRGESPALRAYGHTLHEDHSRAREQVLPFAHRAGEAISSSRPCPCFGSILRWPSV